MCACFSLVRVDTYHTHWGERCFKYYKALSGMRKKTCSPLAAAPSNMHPSVSNTESIVKVIVLVLSCRSIRWWVCWTQVVYHTNPKATTPSPLWRAVWNPLPAWPPAAASAWITSRVWRVWPAYPPCRLCPPCPAPSPTALPPTAHRATPSTTWPPTSTASTDKVRSIDFTLLLFPFMTTLGRRLCLKKCKQFNIKMNF